MALITSFATLQTAVTDYLARSDLSTFTENFIQNAESKLYKRLRIRAMEKTYNSAISSGVLSVPSDYVQMKHAYVNTSPITWLERLSAEQIYSKYPVRSGAEIPKYYAREASSFIFGPYPGDYSVNSIYYSRFTALSSANSTNWFIDEAPDLLLYGSLLEAEPFIKNDNRLTVWKSFYDDSFMAVRDEERREGLSGGSLATRTR